MKIYVKRINTMLLAVLLMVGLTACGGGSTGDVPSLPDNPGSTDTTPPAMTFDQFTSPTNSAAQTVGGTVEAGATVALQIGAQTIPATVNGANWSCNLSGLSIGSNIIIAIASDAAGNPTTVTQKIVYDPNAPTLAVDIIPTHTNQAVLTMTGTVSDDNSVTVSLTVDNNATLDTVSYPTATTWECPLTLIQEGVHNITITADDGANPSETTRQVVYDITAPYVTTTVPADQAIDVAVDSTITITFNEDMDSSLFDGLSIYLRNMLSLQYETIAVSYDVPSQTATVTVPLQTGQTYELFMHTTGVRDLAGNTLSTDFTMTFDTSAVGGPPPLP